MSAADQAADQDPDQAAGLAATSAAAAGFAALGPWGGPIALACSGGADSTFLALAAQRFIHELGPAAAASLHLFVVDHRHAPHTTAAAEAAVALYRELGFAPALLALAPGLRGEHALRRARYAALAAAAAAAGAGVLLTAHQADDQAETLLLRIARGTGLRGLAGIPARRALTPRLELRRPLLGLRRAGIRAALRARGQRWVEDPSNQDPAAAARNRVRTSLMPALATVATGDPVLALLRLAGEAGEHNAALAELLAAPGDWRRLPAYFRRQAIAGHLRAAGATVSPMRLANLEAALLRGGSAAIDEQQRLSLRGGLLRRVPSGIAALETPSPPPIPETLEDKGQAGT